MYLSNLMTIKILIKTVMPLFLPEGKTMKFVLSEFMHRQFAELQLFRVSKQSLHLLLITVLSIPDINRLVSSASNLSFSPGKARAIVDIDQK